MPYRTLESFHNIAKSVRRREPVSRRDLLIASAEGTAGGIGLLLLGACSSSQLISYQGAQRDPRLRQKYIDQIIKENPQPSMSEIKIIYRNDIEAITNPDAPDLRTLMYTEFVIPGMSSTVESLKTEVYRRAFKEFLSEDEFLNSLLDHEYRHFSQLTGGVNVTVEREIVPELNSRVFNIDGDLFVPFLELDAYYEQIKAFSTRPGISDSFKENILFSYNVFRTIVENKEQTPLTRWMLERYPLPP